MAWPRQIYVATSSLGVYYTDDFVDPSTQPTWSAINTGLAATNCLEFWLDPFDPVERQYVMTSTGRVLYRRENGGSWAAILSNSSLGTAVGRTVDIGGFCVDPETDGRLWVLYEAVWDGSNSQFRLARSDDHGDSWVTLLIYSSTFSYTYIHGTVRALGSVLFVPLSTHAGGSQRVYYSTNGGSSWGNYNMGFNALAPLALNPLLTDRSYNRNQNDSDALARITTAGAYTKLQDTIGPPRWDSMWFHPTDSDHQRVLQNDVLHATSDEWTSVSNHGAISYRPISIAPWSGLDTDQMLVGLTLVTTGTPPTQPHVIGALYGEADTTPDRIAGPSPGVAPYTDSIPYNCGGLARKGIQAVPLGPGIYVYGVSYE